MFIRGDGSNGLCILFDSRSKHDQDAEEVRCSWSLGRGFLGKHWVNTLRIALRDHHKPPLTALEIRELRPKLLSFLQERKIKAVVVTQSPKYGHMRASSNAWNIFKPGSPYPYAGTAFKQHDLWVCPVLHPGNYEYAYLWLIARVYKQAFAIAQGILRPMPWPMFHIEPAIATFTTLEAIADEPEIAIDIENDLNGTIITALGFANAKGVVSLPWDSYHIAGTLNREPSLLSYPFGLEMQALAIKILASPSTKIGHNISHDVFFLNKFGYRVGGELEDTLLLHRVAYPHYRHNLQAAASTEFCIEPWKSDHKPAANAYDEDDPWLGDPIELRTYNAKDVYVTYQLYQALKKKVFPGESP